MTAQLTRFLLFVGLAVICFAQAPKGAAPLTKPKAVTVNDVIVMQTALIGEADILCTKDDDFFEKPAGEYLNKMGITVMDDIALMKRLRS